MDVDFIDLSSLGSVVITLMSDYEHFSGFVGFLGQEAHFWFTCAFSYNSEPKGYKMQTCAWELFLNQGKPKRSVAG